MLAETVTADRDYPPFDRSIARRLRRARRRCTRRPGATLRCIGEIRAGSGFDGAVGAGECVQIMTGAAVPAGADAVVMIEHARIDGDRVTFERATSAGQNIVPRGNEARAGQQLLAPGTRLGYAEMALGRRKWDARASMCLPPPARGDSFHRRRSCGYRRCCPGPCRFATATVRARNAWRGWRAPRAIRSAMRPTKKTSLRRRIERGLEADVLVVSGGVSMGKYDLVEMVLSELGAEFLFDAVAIRPGRPAVFGVCRGKPVFGLPGNPVSTMVTFELFVTPAIDILERRGSRVRCRSFARGWRTRSTNAAS